MKQLIAFFILLFSLSAVFAQDSTRCNNLNYRNKVKIRKQATDFCKDSLGLKSWQYRVGDFNNYAIWENQIDYFRQFQYNCDSLLYLGIHSIKIYEKSQSDFNWVLMFDVHNNLVEILEYRSSFPLWNTYWHYKYGKALYTQD